MTEPGPIFAALAGIATLLTSIALIRAVLQTAQACRSIALEAERQRELLQELVELQRAE